MHCTRDHFTTAALCVSCLRQLARPSPACTQQLKQGEIHSTVHAAAYLTDAQQPLEVQLTAYTLLHILVSAL